MKRNSKIRYAGVAAAALLAVAPVAAPAISASTTLPVVQAADTTATATSDAENTAINQKGVAVSSFTLKKDGTGDKVAVGSVDITNNMISAFYDADGDKMATPANDNTGSRITFAEAFTLYNLSGDFNIHAKTFTLNNDNQTLNQAITLGGKAYAMSDLSTVGTLNETDPANSLTFVSATGNTAKVYSDPATTNVTKDTISGDSDSVITKVVKDVNGKIVAYKIAANQYVKASDVDAVALTKLIAKGSVQTTKATTVYKNYLASGFVANNNVYAKGQKVDYSSIYVDQDGNNFAYVIDGDATADGIIKASDVTTSTDSDLTVSTVPAGSQTINSGNKAVVVYNDAATTDKSGSTLSTDYAEWSVTRVAKDADGKVVAYDLGNGQWVKASDVTTDDNTTDGVKVSNTVSGDALYSNWKAAPIYSDPAATKQIRTLSTSYNEWSAFKVSKDANGKIIAYDLGGGQWVKASDLVRQVNLAGTFYTTAGTALTNVNGDKTGTISATGSYQIFAVRYINGHQSLKLGDDSQWIVAANGDYYPA